MSIPNLDRTRILPKKCILYLFKRQKHYFFYFCCYCCFKVSALTRRLLTVLLSDSESKIPNFACILSFCTWIKICTFLSQFVSFVFLQKYVRLCVCVFFVNYFHLNRIYSSLSTEDEEKKQQFFIYIYIKTFIVYAMFVCSAQKPYVDFFFSLSSRHFK